MGGTLRIDAKAGYETLLHMSNVVLSALNKTS